MLVTNRIVDEGWDEKRYASKSTRPAEISLKERCDGH